MSNWGYVNANAWVDEDAWQGLTTNLLAGSEDQRNDQEIQENTKQTSYKREIISKLPHIPQCYAIFKIT